MSDPDTSIGTRVFYAIVGLLAVAILLGLAREYLAPTLAPDGGPVNPFPRIAEHNEQDLRDVGTTLENAG